MFDRAEAYTWLGVVQVELGDYAGAMPNLEEAMRATVMCCRRDHYFAPYMRFALARALEATHGDHKRARDLAVEARAQFPATREAERKRVDLWLATYP
jgi:TolA-binding protein